MRGSAKPPRVAQSDIGSAQTLAARGIVFGASILARWAKTKFGLCPRPSPLARQGKTWPSVAEPIRSLWKRSIRPIVGNSKRTFEFMKLRWSFARDLRGCQEWLPAKTTPGAATFSKSQAALLGDFDFWRRLSVTSLGYLRGAVSIVFRISSQCAERAGPPHRG